MSFLAVCKALVSGLLPPTERDLYQAGYALFLAGPIRPRPAPVVTQSTALGPLYISSCPAAAPGCRGGPKRMKYTLPPLCFCALQTVRSVAAAAAEGKELQVGRRGWFHAAPGAGAACLHACKCMQKMWPRCGMHCLLMLRYLSSLEALPLPLPAAAPDQYRCASESLRALVPILEPGATLLTCP